MRRFRNGWPVCQSGGFVAAQLPLDLLTMERVKHLTLPAQRATRSHSPGQRPGSSNGHTNFRANGPAIRFLASDSSNSRPFRPGAVVGFVDQGRWPWLWDLSGPLGLNPQYALFERFCCLDFHIALIPNAKSSHTVQVSEQSAKPPDNPLKRYNRYNRYFSGEWHNRLIH